MLRVLGLVAGRVVFADPAHPRRRSRANRGRTLSACPPTQTKRAEELLRARLLSTVGGVCHDTDNLLVPALDSPLELKRNQPVTLVFQAEGRRGGIAPVECGSHAARLQRWLFIRLNGRRYAALHRTLLELAARAAEAEPERKHPLQSAELDRFSHVVF